jgi:CBS domain-containing protein
MPRLKDILRRRFVSSIAPGLTVAEAARRMTELNVGAILVLESGKLCGVFSERDLMRRVVVERLDPEKTLVENVMSTVLATADEDTTAEQAMELMAQHKCRHLPVMDEGEVAGFLSMRDLMMDEIERKTEELRHMRNYIQSS